MVLTQKIMYVHFLAEFTSATLCVDVLQRIRPQVDCRPNLLHVKFEQHTRKSGLSLAQSNAATYDPKCSSETYSQAPALL